MVMRTLILFTALLWLMLPSRGFAAQSSLRLVVAMPTVEYGQSARVDLFANGLKPDLGTLKLSALDQDFVVDPKQNVERDSKTGNQHWRIDLYPRHPGELLIPALSFHGYKTEPVKLDVTPAVDGKGGKPLQVNTEISDTAVWTNQAVRVIMKVESDSEYDWLETETTQHDGLNIVKLPRSHTTRIEHGVQRVVHRTGWIVYPQNIGNFSIQLPLVKLHHNGVITHRFYPPKLQLHVRPLPEFVPPTMPIGKIKLDVTLPAHLFMVRRKLAFMTVRITSESPPGLRPSSVLRQLAGSGDVSFYSPQDVVAADEFDSKGAVVHTYQLPFATRSLGLINLPTVRLQYFDPVTGKIKTRTQVLGSVLSISQWMVYAMMIILLIVLYNILRIFYHWLSRRYQIYSAYQKALHGLQHADSPQAIRDGLMIIAAGENWPVNLTLEEWSSRCLRLYPQVPNISESVHQLQDWLYGDRKITLDEIRSVFIYMCHCRVPLLKYPALARLGMQL